MSRCRRPDADATFFAKTDFEKIYEAFDESWLFALIPNNIDFKLSKKINDIHKIEQDRTV